MNNYIILGTKRYKTKADKWDPMIITPRSVRVLQDGSLDATFAGTTIYQWSGDIEAPVTPETSDWGTVSDLQAILSYKGSVSFQDHYGTSYSPAYISKSGPLKSFSPMWDGDSNFVTFEISILAEA